MPLSIRFAASGGRSPAEPADRPRGVPACRLINGSFPLLSHRSSGRLGGAPTTEVLRRRGRCDLILLRRAECIAVICAVLDRSVNGRDGGAIR
jgi:hypothetical protein